MRYMVIETFKPGAKPAVYERFAEKGRMLPGGLAYINSWIEKDGARCFQVMETEEPSLLRVWAENWNDLVDFEFVEVATSAETAKALSADM